MAKQPPARLHTVTCSRCGLLGRSLSVGAYKAVVAWHGEATANDGLTHLIAVHQEDDRLPRPEDQ
jgi:hypothetical protein